MGRPKKVINPGDTFGVIQVIEELETDTKTRAFLCKCLNCGREVEYTLSNLYNCKNSKHCRYCKYKYEEIEIGKKYKNWLVVSEAASRPYKNNQRKVFNCKCLLCNNIYEVFESLLKNPNVSFSCFDCAVRKDHSDEILNKRFGRLYVISKAHYDKHGQYYNTICDCGVEKAILGKSLLSGKTQSCGCLRSEIQRENNSGEKSRFWNGGINIYSRRLRKFINATVNPIIKERDNYICQQCGCSDKQLDVHHIYDKQNYIELALCEYNLITLCIDCHQNDFHIIYPNNKTNTLTNLENWMGNEYKYRNELIIEYNKYY